MVTFPDELPNSEISTEFLMMSMMIQLLGYLSVMVNSGFSFLHRWHMICLVSLETVIMDAKHSSQRVWPQYGSIFGFLFSSL